MEKQRTSRKTIVLSIIVAAFLIGALVGYNVVPALVENQASEEELPGTCLRSYIKKGPFTIYTNPDDANEFAVFRKDRAIVFQDYSEDGRIQRDYYDNRFSMLMLILDKEEKILETFYKHNNPDGITQIAYSDTNNDGIWDQMHDVNKLKTFIWKGGRWEEKEARSERAGGPGEEQ